MTKNQKILIGGVGCLAVIVLGVVVFFAVGGAGYYFYRNPSPPENAFPQQVGKFTRILRPIFSSRQSNYVLHQTSYERADGESVDYSVSVFSSPEAANAEMNRVTSATKGSRREPRTNQSGQQVGEYTVYPMIILFTHDSWYIEIRPTGISPSLSQSEEFARGLPFW